MTPAADAVVSERGIRDYFAILSRRWLLIVVVTLGVVAVAAGVSLRQSKTYRASAKVLFLQFDASSLLADNAGGANLVPTRSADADRVLGTQIQVLRSDSVVQEVRRRVGRPLPPVSVSQVPQTDIIQIRSASTDPKLAADVANTYAEVYLSLRREQDVGGVLSAQREVQASIDALEPQLRSITSEISAAPLDQRDAVRTRLAPTQASLQKRLDDFYAKQDRLKLAGALNSGGAQLITPAKEPTRPFKPRVERSALLALGIGAFFALMLALAVDFLDDGVKDETDLQRALDGVPILGVVRADRRGTDRLTTLSRPTSASAEGFRSLRTAVLVAGSKQAIFPLQLTSPTGHDHTTAANLAVVLAQGDHRVVLVDADLRRSSIDDVFGFEGTDGLSSVLLGRTALDAVQRRPKGEERLTVVPSGPPPPNPSQLLASPAMKEMLSSVSELTEVVVLDSAPVLPYADAELLSSLVSATILVVHAPTTTKRSIRQALARLRAVDAPLLGVVVRVTARRRTHFQA